MTSNATERWNCKDRKCYLQKIWLKSELFVDQLITSLWLKETIRNNKHFVNCFIDNINLTRICQENVKVCNFTDIIKRESLDRVA